MSESASNARSIPSQPFPDDLGSASNAAPLLADGARPILDEQPTVISNELPLAAPHADGPGQQACHSGLLPGDRLEHFELVEFIGGGGMGRVFRARDTRLGRMVALKVLAPGQTGDAEALARFQNEAQSAARLDHENIARVFHVGEDRGLHYIVFEYIEGVNLRALIHENGPLPLADAISYTLQVAEAVAHSASHDVVHRDIKPSNVLVTPSGRAKLIDMGLARLHKVDTVAADLTASGVTLGTFDYISPEQARDPRNADERSDIYSLGCTFFFMLAGRPPFPEGTVLQKLLQHQGDEPPDVRQFRSDAPEELVLILRRMLAKDPRKRYGTASDLLDDLSALARQLGLRPFSASGHVWDVPHPARVSPWAQHLPWLAPTVALLCVVAGLHMWGGNENPAPPVLGGPEVLFGELPDPDEFAPALPAKAGRTPAANPPAPGDSIPAIPPEPDRSADGTAETDLTTAPEARPDPSISDPSTSDAPAIVVPAKSSATVNTGGRLGPEATFARIALGSPGETVARLSDGAAETGRLAFAAQEAVELYTPEGAEPQNSEQVGVLVVNGGGTGDKGFSSLSAALAAAETGNVIELRYNGPREQEAVKLANQRLTVRGGEGFRPVIVFQPNGNDPVKQPRSMLTVASGELALVNLAVELDVSGAVPAEQWSLVEASGGARLSFQRSTLSIRNTSDGQTAYHPDVAFFRTRPAPGADRVTPGVAESSIPAVAIELVDCAVRGQAVLLQAEAFQPVQLNWENGLLATTEQLVSLAGGAHAPAENKTVALNLSHLTALVGGGLLTMTDRQPAARQFSASIALGDSIVVGVPGVPFLNQYAEEGADPRQKIRFQGNRNFYEGFDVFWRLSGPRESESSTPLDFEAWKSHWGSEDENLPSLGRVTWEHPPALPMPVHLVRVSDFALARDATANPARGAASNGRNAGSDLTRLPSFPAP